MAGIRRAQENDKEFDSWQMTYCSVIMILVAIFMMVISYSQIGGKNKSGTLSRTVASKIQGTSGTQRAGLDNPTEDLIESTVTELKHAMAGEGMSDKYTLSRVKGGIKLSAAGDLFFPTGASTLGDEGRSAMPSSWRNRSC